MASPGSTSPATRPPAPMPPTTLPASTAASGRMIPASAGVSPPPQTHPLIRHPWANPSASAAARAWLSNQAASPTPTWAAKL